MSCGAPTAYLIPLYIIMKVVQAPVLTRVCGCGVETASGGSGASGGGSANGNASGRSGGSVWSGESGVSGASDVSRVTATDDVETSAPPLHSQMKHPLDQLSFAC